MARPGIRVSEMAKLLNADPVLIASLARAVVDEDNLNIDFD
jgi:hypothetical protein